MPKPAGELGAEYGAGAASGRRRPAGRRRDSLPRPIAASLLLPESHVEVIEQSHERCAALGLSRIGLPAFDPLGRSDLAVVRERNRRLHAHAAPIMGMLFDQIVGTESLVVLCDSAGTIIHSIGDDDFLSRASKVALAPGVNWSEQAKGTNAIGTALIEEGPTLVHADEHFMHANHFLTCSAAPILDPRGNILGALDVSGDHRSYHQHTMALVRMSARMIENHWLSDDFSDQMRLHFHARPDMLGTLMEGILAVTPEGRIVGANRGALDQLGAVSGAALRMQTLGSLFGTTVGALVDWFRSPLARPLPVRTDDGRAFHVHGRFNWPVWSHVTEAARAAVVTPPPAVVRPGRAGGEPGFAPAAAPARAARDPAPAAPTLEQLDTGDARMASLLGKLRRVLDRGIPVLLIGETGTGKSVLARAMHQASRRAGRPFVRVDCATVSDAELFGGGADAGLLAQAQGGCLLLDEVGELPVGLQLRLLRALQDGVRQGAGPSGAAALDVAIVSTARPPPTRRADGSAGLRDDLFYRLDGLTLTLPPLRERSDLPALVRRLLDQDPVGRAMRPSVEVMAGLAAHRWPGNLRELDNVLRAAVALAAPEPLLTLAHLPDAIVPPTAGGTVEPTTGPGPAATAPAPRSLEDVEIDAIRTALAANDGNVSQAARQLGVSRNTIYRKLRGRLDVAVGR